MMIHKFCLLLGLLWSLVEVQSQTAPYVSFVGENLPKHAYLDITALGEDRGDPGNTVRCHTDLQSCCEDSNDGKWYFPNGTELPFPDDSNIIFDDRESQVVHIRRVNDDFIPPSGIYHCEIETNAVNDNDDNTITGEIVYVGLYLPNEGIYT